VPGIVDFTTEKNERQQKRTHASKMARALNFLRITDLSGSNKVEEEKKN
jgi:hypothetical protein